jgi:hypothetical protein
MKTIYSILYVTLNTALNEKVSIGLLMSDGKYDRFRFSADKLLALKGIIEPERYNLVKGYLKSLESDINVAGDEKVVFENKTLKNNWVNEGYISYLSRYSNNLIQFSEPKAIDITFSPENFRRLFEKYIYAFDQKIEEVFVESIFTKVKQELYPKITNRVNLDFSLDSSHFENLFAPIEVNFIGINGMPVAGQTIDFDKKHHFLENDIARFVSLTKAIELEGKEKGKYFVLGHEPDKKDDKNHLLWEQIKDSKFLEFVDVNDVDRVEEYIEKHEVKPYFAE